MPAPSYLTNHVLIAMPSMQDPNFARTVTYVCEHSDHGAMGIVINRPSELKLRDVLAQMSLPLDRTGLVSTPVFLGGPVQPERGWVLHDPGGQWESSFLVSDWLAVTTSRDILAALAEGRGPRRAMLALGYAGWSAGQLDREMLENAWLTAEATPQLLFEIAPEERWESATRLVGINPSTLSNYAGHA
jgi:putative transcriptional regulator